VDALAGHLLGTAAGDAEGEIEEVRGQAAELESQSGIAAGDVDRLVEAGRRAQSQLGSLGGYAGRAQKSLSAVSASLSGLETSAIASQLAAAQAAEMAEQACGVVKEAVAGTEKLRGAVGDAKKRITALGRRSDDVDQILDFIAEVAGRTNLLSLNASIIATQAGEHGKAFAVVADQIGELANQISASTKSIAEIIGSVRDDVNGTARLIEGGDGLAAEGVARIRKLLEALQGITAATAREHETAAAIRDAVQTHAQSTWEVSESVASIGHSSESLGEALQTMNRSVNAVGSATRILSDMASGVARAVEQRLGAGRRKRQGQGAEKIETMLADIRRAVENHDAAARRVQETLSQLTMASERSDAVAVELSRVAGGLEERSRDLAASVGGFKI
jgi:methyl-accepting chemotaxis protein